jgi:serine carboxypeptidase 1
VANILFVDNPVGTGYSYVDDIKLLTTDVKEIADDLVNLFAEFLKTHTIFQELPFYIFCESYGGKMTAAFGVALNQAIQSGTIRVKFKGVALGDGWVSPIDSVKTWGPYLYANSLIDYNGLNQLEILANNCKTALDNNLGVNATHIWGKMEDVIEKLTDNVNVYNILDHNGNVERIVNQDDILERQIERHVRTLHKDALTALMNGEIKKKLNIPANVTWGGQSNDVFKAQSEDFMKDVISDVDSLLTSGIKVVIYSGQLDLIVDTMGTLAWIRSLQWPNLNSFLSAHRTPLYPPSGKHTKDTGAFLQYSDNLYFYWILKAGHMVPIDAGEMALEMLKMVINDL